MRLIVVSLFGLALAAWAAPASAGCDGHVAASAGDGTLIVQGDPPAGPQSVVKSDKKS
ncbi:hypothetical protein SH611_18020 [Geminicoccaceae bacterium 1502E]|nr:hypothetical protein [Geminicoccaceae bacterium 1502E]